MIEELMVHRFRGIREGRIKDFARINILVGPNNNGKTAILEMLYLSLVCGKKCGLLLEDTGDQFDALVPLKNDFLGFGPLPHLWMRHGDRAEWSESPASLTEGRSLVCRLEHLKNKHLLREFRLVEPISEGVKFRGFFQKDATTLALFTLDRPEGLPSELVTPYLGEETSVELARLAYLWYPQFVFIDGKNATNNELAIWALYGDVPAPDRILFFDFHLTESHFQQKFFNWAQKNVPGWFHRLSDIFGRVFPDAKGVRAYITNHTQQSRWFSGYIEWPDRPALPIDAYGDGARHAFRVLAGLIALSEAVDDEHPGLFLWEDPELFMHPATLGRLLKEVSHLVREKPIQVFIATQSLEVVAYFTDYAAKKHIFPETLRTFRLRIRDGRLFYSRFKYENLVSWLEDGMDPRFWEMPDTLLKCRMGAENE